MTTRSCGVIAEGFEVPLNDSLNQDLCMESPLWTLGLVLKVSIIKSKRKLKTHVPRPTSPTPLTPSLPPPKN